MGYTNKTTHYELPQYVATDKPKYLTDFNETMVAIDTQMYANAQAAATADGKAVAAKDVADGAVSSIGTLNAQINGDPQDPSDTGLNGEVSDLNTDVNTIQSLIGDGHPTTSNQTIIGAVNGLEGALAPREDGTILANSYTAGEQFARGGSIYTALTDLAAETEFASLTLNTDYKNSDTLTEQIADAGSEITRVETIVNGIKYRKTGEVTVSITADGVKTYAQLIPELQAAIVDSIGALADGVKAYYEQVVITALGTYLPLERYTDNGLTASWNAHFNQMFATSSSLYLRSIHVRSANSINSEVKIDYADNAVTATELGSTVPADNSKLEFTYSTWEVVA